MTGEPLLRIRDVSFASAAFVALDRVSFDVGRGEICGLIGPNGAGKTTLFNCLSRLYTPNAGEIVFRGSRCSTCRATPSPGSASAARSRTSRCSVRMSVRHNITGGRALPHPRPALSATRCGCRRCAREEAAIGRRDRCADRVARPARRSPICRSTNCRSAPGSASNWRARWPPSPSCCCSTSRPAASTMTRSINCAH